MEYNTSKTDLILKEYGRNIQKLVKYVVTVEDKEQRTQYANTLIELMRQLNPVMKESPTEYSQKLWDDLYIMSEFTLEVDSPFPMPEKELLGKKPKRMDYNTHKIGYKHYGRNIELLIQKAIEIEDEEERDAAVLYIGRLMKSFYSTWNKEVVDEEVIIGHIRELSKNQLNLDVAKVKESSLFESTTSHRDSRTDRGDRNLDRDRSRTNKPRRPSTGKTSTSNNNPKRRKN